MSLVSSGLTRFLPFGAQERRQRTAAAAAATASNYETAEIAAVEFADAFAQFNSNACHRREFLLAQQASAGAGGHRKGMMTPLLFEAARRSADEEDDDGATIAFAEEASTSDCDYDYDKLKAVMPSGPFSMGGGLKRTVSSLHIRGGSLTALAANSVGSSRSSSIASSPGIPSMTNGQQLPFCWHSAASSAMSSCLVQANQIEMEFLSMSAQPFDLIVYAPSGEHSQRLAFRCGRTAMFAPRRAGCGHGNWRFEIRVHDAANGKKTTKKTEEVLYFDGVGTLYFCVDANLRLTLTSQQFLRLPSHNRCCASSLKHSATQPAFR